MTIAQLTHRTPTIEQTGMTGLAHALNVAMDANASARAAYAAIYGIAWTPLASSGAELVHELPSMSTATVPSGRRGR